MGNPSATKKETCLASNKRTLEEAYKEIRKRERTLSYADKNHKIALVNLEAMKYECVDMFYKEPIATISEERGFASKLNTIDYGCSVFCKISNCKIAERARLENTSSET